MLQFIPLLFLALFGMTAEPEVQVPKNEGWVTDLAGVLAPQEEAQLEALMESYKRGSGHEIALLTVSDMGGETIERFTLEVGRAWKMGSSKNDAALLVVSTGDRKMRIEVGQGLEGNLTDLISGRIIRDVITPHFKAGRMSEGIRQGVLAMHAAIGGDYAAIENSHGRRRSRRRGGGNLVFMMVIGFAVLMGGSRGRGRGPGGRGGMGSMLPWLILGSMGGRSHGGGSFGGGGGGGGGFSGFGGGGGFSGGGASGGW